MALRSYGWTTLPFSSPEWSEDRCCHLGSLGPLGPIQMSFFEFVARRIAWKDRPTSSRTGSALWGFWQFWASCSGGNRVELKIVGIGINGIVGNWRQWNGGTRSSLDSSSGRLAVHHARFGHQEMAQRFVIAFLPIGLQLLLLKHFCCCGCGCYCNWHRIGQFQARESAWKRSERSRPHSSLLRTKSVTSPMASRCDKEGQRWVSRCFLGPLPPHYFILRRHSLRNLPHRCCFVAIYQLQGYLRSPVAEPPVTWSHLFPNLITITPNYFQLGRPDYCFLHRR